MMNRKKKINQTLKSKAKKANAKLQSSNKPKYIAKADRQALAGAVEHEIPSKAAEPLLDIALQIS